MEYIVDSKKLDRIASDVFVLFGGNTKRCKVEYNLVSDKVRKINSKTVLDKFSIVLDRNVIEQLSMQVEIKDLEARMIETVRRGLIKVFEKMGIMVKTQEPEPEPEPEIINEAVQGIRKDLVNLEKETEILLIMLRTVPEIIDELGIEQTAQLVSRRLQK